MSSTVRFFVPGECPPKGSVEAWKHPRTGKVIRRDAVADRFKAWKTRLGWEARKAGVQLSTGAVTADVVFRMPRPKNHYKANGELKDWAKRLPHVTKPDRDKLLRSLQDAMTNLGVADDSQIDCGSTTKVYADTPGDVGTHVTWKPTDEVTL